MPPDQDMPQYLYHGFDWRKASQVETNGLRPQKITRTRAQWSYAVESRPDSIYLTDVYAPYCSFMASDDELEDFHFAIAEVDTTKLDTSRWRPDEDYLAQVDQREMSLADAVKWYRDHIDMFADHYLDSLKMLGTVAYQGRIRSQAIARISVKPMKGNELVGLPAAADPLISILNHRFCAKKYAYITKVLMGDEPPAEDEYEFDRITCGKEVADALRKARVQLEAKRKAEGHHD